MKYKFLTILFFLLISKSFSQELKDTSNTVIGYIQPNGQVENKNHKVNYFITDTTIENSRHKVIGYIVDGTHIENKHHEPIGTIRKKSATNEYYLIIGYIYEGAIKDSEFETIGYFEKVNYKWACIYFLFLDKL